MNQQLQMLIIESGSENQLPDKFTPFSPISVWSPLGNVSRSGSKQQAFRTAWYLSSSNLAGSEKMVVKVKLELIDHHFRFKSYVIIYLTWYHRIVSAIFFFRKSIPVLPVPSLIFRTATCCWRWYSPSGSHCESRPLAECRPCFQRSSRTQKSGASLQWAPLRYGTRFGCS